MPLFFLHLRDGDEFIEDLEGKEYPNAAAAKEDAQVAAREILAERVRLGRIIDGQRIEITDASGNDVETVVFRDQMRL